MTIEAYKKMKQVKFSRIVSIALPIFKELGWSCDVDMSQCSFYIKRNEYNFGVYIPVTETEEAIKNKLYESYGENVPDIRYYNMTGLYNEPNIRSTYVCCPDENEDIISNASFINSISRIKFLPENVLEIDSMLFTTNSSRTLQFNTKLEAIYEKSFMNCNIKDIILPNSLKALGKSVFMNSSTETISFSDGLTEIPFGTCYSCHTLKTVTLPNNLVKIEDSAFEMCTSLENIKFPNTLTSIGKYAFSNTNITMIDLPQNLTYLGENAFSNCKKLKYVKLPNTIQTIQPFTFSNTVLKNIIIPEGVTRIEEFAFSNCPYLNKVSIPKSIEFIDKNAFKSSENVEISMTH